MESNSGKDAVKVVEITKKDLEHYTNLIDRAVLGFDKIESSFKTLLWVKCYQTALHTKN